MFEFGLTWPIMGLSKYAGNTRSNFSYLPEIPGYYPPLVYSEEGFEVAIVEPVVSKKELPLVPSHKILGQP